MDYPGIDGFLPFRGSLMLDVVFLAMFAVVPAMWWSIQLAKAGKYGLHKRIQLALAVVLLAAVTLFEVDMRVFGWTERAKPSPYYPGGVWTSLYIHLVCAISTAVLWVAVIVQALRKFPNPPRPNEHSASHKRWAKLAAIDMLLTALTGWAFYYLAFVAK